MLSKCSPSILQILELCIACQSFSWSTTPCTEDKFICRWHASHPIYKLPGGQGCFWAFSTGSNETTYLPTTDRAPFNLTLCIQEMQTTEHLMRLQSSRSLVKDRFCILLVSRHLSRRLAGILGMPIGFGGFRAGFLFIAGSVGKGRNSRVFCMSMELSASDYEWGDFFLLCYKLSVP